MSILKTFFQFLERNLLFYLHCATFVVILFLNFYKGLLLTTTNSTTSALSSQLNRFSVAFGSIDECFLILIFERIFSLHRKFNILSFDSTKSAWLFITSSIYHLDMLIPIHLVLITSPDKLVHLFVLCYDLQLFIGSTVVFDYAKKLYDIRRDLNSALEDSNEERILKCYENYSHVFKECNERYGLLNLYVLTHAMVIITIQANVILMYVFNGTYRHSGTYPRLAYIIIWSFLGLVKLSIICFTCHSTQKTWKRFGVKMGQYQEIYNIAALLLDRKFTAAKCFVINNELLFMVNLFSTFIGSLDHLINIIADPEHVLHVSLHHVPV